MFRATIHEAKKFSEDRVLKLRDSVSLFERAFNTQRFYQSIVNHTFREQQRFYYTQRSNKDIYALLVMGMELFQPQIRDFESDLYLRMIRRRKPDGVAGHSPSDSKYIIIFEDWFDTHLTDEIAGLVAHEYSHKLGFHHPMALNPDTPYSVPYAVGRTVTSLATLMRQGANFQNVKLPGG
ncbi:MAG: hypothetical protein ACFHWX_02140 [Bacteroidota bacterium]